MAPTPGPGDLPVTAAVTIPARELAWRFSRSSGPGGQGVNTTDSRVELIWDVAGSQALPEPLRARAMRRLSGRMISGTVVVVAAQFRSQRRNREAAAARLAALVRAAIAAPAPARRATRPGPAAQQRRVDDKRRRGRTKRLRGGPDRGAE